jgi:hypothetical protein
MLEPKLYKGYKRKEGHSLILPVELERMIGIGRRI